MNHRFSDDRDLRRSFEALREVDLRRVPEFSSVRPGSLGARASAPRSVSRIAGAWAAGALAVAAALAGVVLLLPQRPSGVAVDDAMAQAQEISSWSAPTDTFLVVDSLDSPLESPASRP